MLIASHSTRRCTASSTSSCPVCTGSAGSGSLAGTGTLGIDSIVRRYPGVAGNLPVDQIAGIAAGIPEIQTIFTTAGDPDALAWIRVRDVEDLKRVINLLRRSGRVTGTKTLMVLGTS